MARRIALTTINTISASHAIFWREYPALFYGLSILIGTSAPLFLNHYAFVFLWLTYLLLSKKHLQIIILAASVLYGFLHTIQPPHPTGPITATFSPSIVQPHNSPFQKGLQYKGTLLYENRSIPCSIYIKDMTHNRPKANKNYQVIGVLEQRGSFDFLFKVKQWRAIEKSWSAAEMRYEIKEAFRKLLSQKIKSPQAALFLSSLSTGDVEDRQIRYEFNRLGLQHILAISGFHFGILISFLSFFFRLFLTSTQKMFALFLMITTYMIFVGPSPSVERSYLTALLYLISQWKNLSTSGLNLLGCALCIELIFNPLCSGNLGFQLSFLSCFAILLFYPIFEKKIDPLLPKRTWKEIQSLNLLSQHGYLLSSFFRKSISLTFAINLTLLPLLLFHFHQFPMLSFLYNLFFPFLVGIDLFLLLSSLIFHFLFPPIGDLFFYLTNSIATFLLELASNPPLILDYSVTTSNISQTFVILYLIVIGFWRISIGSKTNPLNS